MELDNSMQTTETPSTAAISGSAQLDSARTGSDQRQASVRGKKRKPRGDADRGERQGGAKRRPDMGRNEWSRNQAGRRTRTAPPKAKPDHVEERIPTLPFSQEDIANEPRRPKYKVAVLIGYSGSGYKGMQVNAKEKTIEGDLFAAMVAAKAISKANANDPKKSSLVRCARTDKGVHAAGNIISLKLIVEDPDVVEQINKYLPPQIRVWGIERTTGSFSCYRLCDSRIYEYIIPTYVFLPPHPHTILGRRIVELAREAGDIEDVEKRQKEVWDFWEKAEEEYIKPVIESLDPSVRESAIPTLRQMSEDPELRLDDSTDIEAGEPAHDSPGNNTERSNDFGRHRERNRPLEEAVKRIKAAYTQAKKAYRIDPARLQRVRDTLQLYTGTHNFHNYTISKAFRDPSAKRHVKSFTADEPKLLGNTEWLSLKVHGQSFMMHQIRKMVFMAALVVRTGSPPERITQSYGPQRLSIPKVPSQGLLLDRPVFKTYNEGIAAKFSRPTIDFDKYKDAMNAFKQKEIYERIYQDEEKDNIFNAYYTHFDDVDAPWCKALVSGKPESMLVPATDSDGRGPGGAGNATAGFDSDDESAVEEGEEGDG